MSHKGQGIKLWVPEINPSFKTINYYNRLRSCHKFLAGVHGVAAATHKAPAAELWVLLVPSVSAVGGKNVPHSSELFAIRPHLGLGNGFESSLNHVSGPEDARSCKLTPAQSVENRAGAAALTALLPSGPTSSPRMDRSTGISATSKWELQNKPLWLQSELKLPGQDQTPGCWADLIQKHRDSCFDISVLAYLKCTELLWISLPTLLTSYSQHNHSQGFPSRATEKESPGDKKWWAAGRKK